MPIYQRYNLILRYGSPPECCDYQQCKDCPYCCTECYFDYDCGCDIEEVPTERPIPTPSGGGCFIGGCGSINIATIIGFGSFGLGGLILLRTKIKNKNSKNKIF